MTNKVKNAVFITKEYSGKITVTKLISPIENKTKICRIILKNQVSNVSSRGLFQDLINVGVNENISTTITKIIDQTG